MQRKSLKIACDSFLQTKTCLPKIQPERYDRMRLGYTIGVLRFKGLFITTLNAPIRNVPPFQIPAKFSGPVFLRAGHKNLTAPMMRAFKKG
jgi:hypothetical protein